MIPAPPRDLDGGPDGSMMDNRWWIQGLCASLACPYIRAIPEDDPIPPLMSAIVVLEPRSRAAATGFCASLPQSLPPISMPDAALSEPAAAPAPAQPSA